MEWCDISLLLEKKIALLRWGKRLRIEWWRLMLIGVTKQNQFSVLLYHVFVETQHQLHFMKCQVTCILTDLGHMELFRISWKKRNLLVNPIFSCELQHLVRIIDCSISFCIHFLHLLGPQFMLYLEYLNAMLYFECLFEAEIDFPWWNENLHWTWEKRGTPKTYSSIGHAQTSPYVPRHEKIVWILIEL